MEYTIKIVENGFILTRTDIVPWIIHVFANPTELANYISDNLRMEIKDD